jgi:hypothetical protein
LDCAALELGKLDAELTTDTQPRQNAKDEPVGGKTPLQKEKSCLRGICYYKISRRRNGKKI